MVSHQAVRNPNDEAESDDKQNKEEQFNFDPLAVSSTQPESTASADNSRLSSVDSPDLQALVRYYRPAASARDSSLLIASGLTAVSEKDLSEEAKNRLQNLHKLKVNFLRILQRVGYTAECSLAARVLYKLEVFSGRPSIPDFRLDDAKETATKLEAGAKDDLNFSLNILVLGKSGVGKSATINSIFGDKLAKTNAFKPDTASVQEICGIVDGIRIRVIDSPGLRSSAKDQGFNRKVLGSIKKFLRKYPLDILLYVDRLDSQMRELNDLCIMKKITSTLGSSIWSNAIIVLTHACATPPDGPAGTPLSYDTFVQQSSYILQHSIGCAIGDWRSISLNTMNPVCLVENHPACRNNQQGQKVLPNGETWRPHLLLLCYSLKILSEAMSYTSEPRDPFDHKNLFRFFARPPSLPSMLSSLLKPPTLPQHSAPFMDIDSEKFLDSDDEEEEDEYDQLPPFRPLRKFEIAKLSKDLRSAYFEEYDYRVKLLQKKQLKEGLRMRRKNVKKKHLPDDYTAKKLEDFEYLREMTLPLSFDSDNPSYRYRLLEPRSKLIFSAWPLLDTHDWDHDLGYYGVMIEENLGIAGQFPAAVLAWVKKDKEEFKLHLDTAVLVNHGENASSSVVFDVQTISNKFVYALRGESQLKTSKKNKATAGLSAIFLDKKVATGVKLEDQLLLGKRLLLVGRTGIVHSQKDAAYEADVEVRLRDADHPIEQTEHKFSLSAMKYRGESAIGGNFQSQFSVGQNLNMGASVSLNNKRRGQITIRTNSSDSVVASLASLIPIAVASFYRLKTRQA